MDIKYNDLKELKNQLDVLRLARKITINCNYGLPNKLISPYNSDEFDDKIETINNKIKKLELSMKINKIINNKTIGDY